jgi:putative tryptophan/tyrosine transport system substrate-binding protein
LRIDITVPWRIGWLDPSMTPTAAASSQALAAFKQRLKELGYVEGRDFVIEGRFADTYWDRLPGMAADLVGRGVDVIVTIGTPTVIVAKQATTTIPIVIARVIDLHQNSSINSISYVARESPIAPAYIEASQNW